MMACGMGCQLLSAKEIPGSPCSPRTRSRKRPRTAKFECFIWRFARTAKIFVAAQQELKKHGIKFEFQDHEIAHSIYFRDPDGHQLEITTYEVD